MEAEPNGARSTADLIRSFSAFIAAARPNSQRTRPAIGTEAFEQFVRLARPLAVSHLKHDLPRLRMRASLASRWWAPHDLLLEAGLSYVENAYTRLMAWALHPATDPPTATLRQRAWLRALSLDAFREIDACEPMTQLVTEDGIPDLVLCYPVGTVIVEAKTGTVEHAVPSGEWQTIGYVPAVRARLGLPANARIEVVLITPDGDEAKNVGAKLTTYAGLALAIAEALDHEAMASSTREAFSMLFTHFLAVSVGRVETRWLIEQTLDWSVQEDWNDDTTVLRHMRVLQQAMIQLRLKEEA